MGVPPRRAAACTSGDAAATVRAHDLAKMARRTVPYGFSCSSCAHMGRLAPRFSHVSSQQQPRSRPPRKYRLGCSGGGSLPQIFSRILGNSWLPVLTPRSGAHVVHFWTKNIFCSNACVVAKFKYRNAPTFFYFWGIAAFCCDRKHSRGHPSEASCGARNTENPVFPGGRGYPQARCSLYITGVRQRRRVRVVSRKRRAEPSHMASVAPPARIWDDSPHSHQQQRPAPVSEQ